MTQDQDLGQTVKYAKAIRLVRPSVVVLCGPAACGKSTFAAQHFRSTAIVSSDRARALVCDDEQDQRFQTQAFALLHFLIEQRLSINRLCVVDSTALTEPARRNLIELARKHQVPCVAIVLDVPLQTCIERDLSRTRSVGRAVIERQYSLFEQARQSLKQEGFDQVIELKDQDLGQIQLEIIFRPVTRKPASVAPRRPAAQVAPSSSSSRPAPPPGAAVAIPTSPPTERPRVRVIQVSGPTETGQSSGTQSKPADVAPTKGTDKPES